MTQNLREKLLTSDAHPGEAWGLHQGDSRNLSEILAGSFQPAAEGEPFIDATITSPPYADLINYEAGEDEIGVNSDYAEYLTDLRLVFQKIYELTRDMGTLWIVVDDFRKNGRVVPLPQDIVDICENLFPPDECNECGETVTSLETHRTTRCHSCGEELSFGDDSWVLRDTVIWNKKKARPWSGAGQFRNSFEYILYFGKTTEPEVYPDKVRIADPSQLSKWWVDWPERYHPCGTLPTNVWEIEAHTRGQWGDSQNTHPAAFPPELVSRILRYSTVTGDVVFDPFAGSGTVPSQAEVMDRLPIGIELNPDFVSTYDTVREEVTSRWNDLVAHSADPDSQQQRLAKNIWGLRQLVYGKKLCVQLRQELNLESIKETGIHSVFIESHANPEDWRAVDHPTTTYTFAYDEKTAVDSEAVQRVLREASGEQPWSGFNIDSTITVEGVRELRRELEKEDDKYYLYPRGEHWQFSRRLSGSEWASQATPVAAWRDAYATRKFPPLLSNRGIVVDRNKDSPRITDTGLLDGPPEKGDERGGATIRGTQESYATKLTDFSQTPSEPE